MLALERKQAVLEFVRQRQICATREIVETLGIPKVTAHRLLTELESEELLEKIHGGVRATPASGARRNFNRRLSENREAKRAMARLAVQLVEPGSTVFLDSSTTCLHLARELARTDGPPCAIVTDSPTLVHELCGFAHLRIVCTGGELNHELNRLTGPLALETIRQLNFSHAFVSAGGASLQHGATTWETDIAVTVRAVHMRAARTYLLVDGSKFTRVAPHTIAPLTEFAAVIVDRGLPAAARAELAAAGVEVLG